MPPRSLHLIFNLFDTVLANLMSPVPMDIIFILSFTWNLIQTCRSGHGHRSGLTLLFFCHLFVFFSCCVVLGVTGLYYLSSEVLEQKFRLFKLVKNFLRLIDLIPMIDATNLKPRDIEDTDIIGDVVHATWGIIPYLRFFIFVHFILILFITPIQVKLQFLTLIGQNQ